jgi:D-serine deaminase-like pyridoxal phosphate-dependent protein
MIDLVTRDMRLPIHPRSWQPIALERPISVDEIPTPALVVDVAAMERNLDRMTAFLAAKGKVARPHSKTHKCPIIARRQLEGGAIGICCAKVSEAEAMVEAGVGPVLVTSPVVTFDKTARVARIAAGADPKPRGRPTNEPPFTVVLDSRLGAEVLARSAESEGVRISVLIDLDVGTGRTGVAPGQPALELARRITELGSLELRGLQAYAGHLMHVDDFEDRRARSRQALGRAVETRRLLAEHGILTEVLTGAGTGTFDIDCDLEEMTDLQVGSYLFMDAEYRCIGASSEGTEPKTLARAFEPALFVLATAISQPRSGTITIDAGAKAMPYEKTRPEVCDVEGVRYHWAGDEHGILELQKPSRPIELGDRLRLIPAHCDPTVNLYDFYWPLVGGEVRELWPISARGCSQ